MGLRDRDQGCFADLIDKKETEIPSYVSVYLFYGD